MDNIFGVVMSIYNGDKPNQVKESIQSLLDQTLLPSKILINIDGPINKELENSISEYFDNPLFSFYRTPVNRGLGHSRRLLINLIDTEYIAVMDSDDIAVKNRFELQLEKLKNENLDIVGGYIEEFKCLPGDLKIIRKVAIKHNEIVKAAKWRQPMNHVTVIFKKNIYEKTGGYHDIRNVEDYDLFYRMIKVGASFGNINKVLVMVRCDNNFYARRRGFSYLKNELKIFNQMYFDKFIDLRIFIFNVAVRILCRFLPKKLLNIFYKFVLRSKN